MAMNRDISDTVNAEADNISCRTWYVPIPLTPFHKGMGATTTPAFTLCFYFTTISQIKELNMDHFHLSAAHRQSLN